MPHAGTDTGDRTAVRIEHQTARGKEGIAVAFLGLVEACIEAHRPDPDCVRLGIEDVLYALERAGVSDETLTALSKVAQERFG